MFSKFLEITTKSVILNAKTVGGKSMKYWRASFMRKLANT